MVYEKSVITILVRKYLYAWKLRNWADMFELTRFTDKQHASSIPELTAIYKDYKIRSGKIKDVIIDSESFFLKVIDNKNEMGYTSIPANTRAEALINVKWQMKLKSGKWSHLFSMLIGLKLCKELSKYQADINGTWGIDPITLYRFEEVGNDTS